MMIKSVANLKYEKSKLNHSRLLDIYTEFTSLVSDLKNELYKKQALEVMRSKTFRKTPSKRSHDSPKEKTRNTASFRQVEGSFSSSTKKRKGSAQKGENPYLDQQSNHHLHHLYFHQDSGYQNSTSSDHQTFNKTIQFREIENCIQSEESQIIALQSRVLQLKEMGNIEDHVKSMIESKGMKKASSENLMKTVLPQSQKNTKNNAISSFTRDPSPVKEFQPPKSTIRGVRVHKSELYKSRNDKPRQEDQDALSIMKAEYRRKKQKVDELIFKKKGTDLNILNQKIENYKMNEKKQTYLKYYNSFVQNSQTIKNHIDDLEKSKQRLIKSEAKMLEKANIILNKQLNLERKGASFKKKVEQYESLVDQNYEVKERISKLQDVLQQKNSMSRDNVSMLSGSRQ